MTPALLILATILTTATAEAGPSWKVAHDHVGFAFTDIAHLDMDHGPSRFCRKHFFQIGTRGPLHWRTATAVESQITHSR